MELLTATALSSHARTRASLRPPLRIGAVQAAWHPDPDQHAAALDQGIRALTQ
jgi:hypothetical protein